MSGNNSGWNRPAANQPTVKKGGYPPAKQPEGAARRGAKAPSKVKGIVAGLVTVCALGGLCLWMFSGGDDAPKAKAEKERGRIKEVTPAAAPTNRVEEVKVKERPRFWEVPASQTNGFTWSMQLKWRHEHRPKPAYTNTSSLTELPPEYAIFDHYSENVIAGYLTHEPGDTLVGEPSYGRHFVADFLESLKTPIIATKDDTPYQQELKRLMNETKIELKARYDAGEDIGKILEETHAQQRELAVYKADIERELVEFRRNPEVTIEDVDDFVKAANIMLEKKGIAPITLGPIAKRMLLRRQKIGTDKQKE